MCGSVSRATVAENARRRVARDSAGGTKRWNAKARKGRNRRGYLLASRAHAFYPGTGAGGAESARMPGMVGRERRGGHASAASGTPVSLLTGRRQRRAGRAATYTPVRPAATLGDPATVLADSERARPPRSSRDPASTAGTRRAAVVAGRRAAEGFQERSLSRTRTSLFADGLRFVLDDDVHTVR